MNEWTYENKKEIRNFKDLELEKQRLKLYQKFLGELLDRDKLAFKKSIEPQNLLSSSITGFMNNENSSNIVNNLGTTNVITSVIKWLLKKIFQ